MNTVLAIALYASYFFIVIGILGVVSAQFRRTYSKVQDQSHVSFAILIISSMIMLFLTILSFTLYGQLP